MKVDIGITVYAKPLRLQRLLDLMQEPREVRSLITVFEDPSSEEHARTYGQLCRQRGIPYQCAPQWGCMQGIIQYATERTSGDWFLYLPDDVMPTPQSITWALRWMQLLPEHVAAFQMPYWNYDQLRTLNTWEERDNLFQESPEWIAQVPLNPHWYGPALYLNVNGAGFAFRRKAWEAVGGFAQQTWCLDEDLSCKIWLRTDWTIVSVPGPPWIHQGGASTTDQHKFGHAHMRHATIEGWLDAWGESKDVLGERCRERMRLAGERTGWPVR